METWEKKEHYMIRKLLVIAAAIAMPVSVVALASGSATAAGSHSSTTDTIACKTITGTVTFSPKLDKTGYTNQAIKTTVSSTLTGCTVKGSTPYKVSKGTITGSITGVKGTVSKPAGTCTGLLGSSTDTGTLTSKWSVSSGSVPPNSVLGIKSVKGGTAGGHGTFTLPGSVKGTASGSFQGANKGASDISIAETVDRTSQFLTACDGPAGVSSLKIQTEPGKTAVSLG